MSIDINQETLYTLTEAAKHLPTLNGRKVSVSTMWRWCAKGIRGVHLDHVRIGRRICTSVEALNRFANALAEQARENLTTPPETITPANSRRASNARPVSRATLERANREAAELLDRVFGPPKHR
jgi:hypothetical protein